MHPSPPSSQSHPLPTSLASRENLDDREVGEITCLLRSWQDGGSSLESSLLDQTYRELQEQAAQFLRRERSDHTLEPRALVHEAYLRLRAQRHVDWRNRKHFFAVAAITMRRILLDHARTKKTHRREAELLQIECLDHLPSTLGGDLELLHLQLTLNRLAQLEPRLASVVHLHCFAGLSLDETADATGRSRRTVARDWALARAWLVKELRPGGLRPSEPRPN